MPEKPERIIVSGVRGAEYDIAVFHALDRGKGPYVDTRFFQETLALLERFGYRYAGALHDGARVFTDLGKTEDRLTVCEKVVYNKDMVAGTDILTGDGHLIGLAFGKRKNLSGQDVRTDIFAFAFFCKDERAVKLLRDVTRYGYPGCLYGEDLVDYVLFVFEKPVKLKEMRTI